MERLPDYTSLIFPGATSEEIGFAAVKVSSIIGGNPERSKEYLPNFEPVPVDFDLRYSRVERMVKKMIKAKKPDAPLYLGNIHLLEIDGKYFVCRDGHRRVSVIKIISPKETILAEVTRITNPVKE